MPNGCSMRSSAVIALCVMQDPLAIIGLAGILLPFIILGIAIATGVIDTSAGSQYGTGKP